MLWAALWCSAAASAEIGQYIVVNRMPEGNWNQARPETITGQGLEEIKRAVAASENANRRVGVSFVFSYLKTNEGTVVSSLKRFLAAARETRTPVLVKLDGENWWQGRPDLWNWWDPNAPGYDPANRHNVEWTGWGPEHAVRIAWRNWGRQIRVAPPPNLMSPRYRSACREKMEVLLPIVVDWYRDIPDSEKDLFIGINLGWESSIGVNAWYYPDGNRLLTESPAGDPQAGLDAADVTARGQVQLGHAALTAAGIRTTGAVTEQDLFEVVRRHLEDLSRTAREGGLAREHIFTHAAGWRAGELLYDAAVNDYACPGWSFYHFANDPAKDEGVQRALGRSGVDRWAASEWWLPQPHEYDLWYGALKRTLADERCRFVCIYNWEGIKNSGEVLRAIRAVVDERKDR